MMAWWNWLSKGDSSSAPPERDRWVVVDVETSGLDPEEAHLLAIAAVAIDVDWQAKKLSIVPGDSFEVDIRPPQLVRDKENILVHGIGQRRQMDGQELPLAIASFAQFIGSAKLLAFHAWFDKALIGRHVRIAAVPGLDKGLSNPWVDIERLCVATYPDLKAHSLDEWMDQFDISCAARHEAAADTYAECEVLQRIWPRIAKQANGWSDILRLEKEGRWLSQSSR